VISVILEMSFEKVMVGTDVGIVNGKSVDFGIVTEEVCEMLVEDFGSNVVG